MVSSRASALVLCAVLLASGAALGYGGGLRPIEKDDKGNATDYRNPQADPRQPPDAHPRRYHVTVCADNTWYGPWTPPEWRGLDGAVSTNITAKGQSHGYAKGSDGTDGGLQVKGGGTGSTDPTSISFSNIALTKHGVTIILTIRVIQCPGAQPYSPKNPKGKVDVVAEVKPGG